MSNLYQFQNYKPKYITTLIDKTYVDSSRFSDDNAFLEGHSASISGNSRYIYLFYSDFILL